MQNVTTIRRWTLAAEAARLDLAALGRRWTTARTALRALPA
jgi:hypothetical protein